ncbi:MAG: glucose-6-phosphate dehydrogenase [Deltaproteobacteria bacterium]|nr:glucose-6-phosphate dehydrogenase [Deltaproteobacteria bacterium]MBN2670749.1 glucose-6-phosphate dehydrogenase [Deltaproteobacteria bacterium]
MAPSIDSNPQNRIKNGLFCKSAMSEATFVIFGATGDLTMRKLVPALYNLCVDGLLPEDFKIVTVARSAKEPAELLERFRQGVEKFSRSGFKSDVWEQLARRISYVQVDYSDDSSYRTLESHLGIRDPKNVDRRYLFYLATPPTSFNSIIRGLGKNRLVTPAHHHDGPCTRVVFEKPFGRDLTSALELNTLAKQYLDETQMFRMDHYLGKETVQNILVFRFANSIFEPIWNRRYISHVRITAFENIGIEGRGAFYEEAGVIRDVLQNHLLQILSLCAMEPPNSFEAEHIRDERAKVFKALRPLYADDIKDHVSLAQYDGYLSEKGVAADSKTPTFASVRLFIDNWRWEGVPFILSTGKNLKEKMTQIEIHYTPVPLCLFKENDVCMKLEPNVLTIRIQPEEGISLRFGTKTPGEKQDVSPVNMHFDFQHSFKGQAQQEAYEKLLLDCLRGNQTLFARQEEVEHMWHFVAPLLEGAQSGELPMGTYTPGTSGPEVKP